MKLFRFLTLLWCLAAVSTLQSQDTDLADSIYIRKHYDKREVMIPMRDGVKLFTSIYTPKDPSKKHPFILRRTPYSCAPYGPDAYVKFFQNMHMAREGYIFVIQDVRGRYMSEGDFVDVRPFNPQKAQKTDIDEASDTYDTVDWLLANTPNNNGRVGVWGISYPGFYATMTILARHPAIKAVSPQAPVTDWFIGDDFHHNGAFFQMDAFAFYSGFGKKRPQPTTKSAKAFSDWNTPDNYDFYLRTGALPNFNKLYLKDSIAFWNELMQHPNYDAWWQARNPRPHLREVMPAVMTVGGLFDAEDTWGAWNVYKTIETQNPATVSNRVVMGPWVHGGWARTPGDRLGNVTFGAKTSDYYQKEIELPFFEFYLKDNGAMNLPDARIFETGANRWTQYDVWPPKEAVPTKIFFREKGGLDFGAPKTAVAWDEYVSDPAKPVAYTEDIHLRRTREYMCDDQRFAARRPDVLAYKTDVLNAPVTVTGPVIADLLVRLDNLKPGGPRQLDADFVVKLIDVYPDTLSSVENNVPMGGYQMLVRGEIMRGRFRNNFSTPAPFVPGQTSKVRFELPDVAHTFLPGHRIMVQVQSSWFPLADRNPQKYVDIYKAKDEDFIPVRVSIQRGANGSGLILPVLKK
jgi:uncharacterized protein